MILAQAGAACYAGVAVADALTGCLATFDDAEAWCDDLSTALDATPDPPGLACPGKSNVKVGPGLDSDERWASLPLAASEISFEGLCPGTDVATETGWNDYLILEDWAAYCRDPTDLEELWALLKEYWYVLLIVVVWGFVAERCAKCRKKGDAKVDPGTRR